MSYTPSNVQLTMDEGRTRMEVRYFRWSSDSIYGEELRINKKIISQDSR